MAVLLWHHALLVEYVINHHCILKCQIPEYYVVSSTAAFCSTVFNFKWKQGEAGLHIDVQWVLSLLGNHAKQLPSFVLGLERESSLPNSCAAIGTILTSLDIFNMHPLLCCPASICFQCIKGRREIDAQSMCIPEQCEIYPEVRVRML